MFKRNRKMELINLIVILVFFISVLYQFRIKTNIYGLLKAVGLLPLMLKSTKINTTVGIPILNDRTSTFSNSLNFKQDRFNEFRLSLIKDFLDRNPDMNNNYAVEVYRNVKAHIIHPHVCRWFETKFGTAGIFQKFTSNRPREGAFCVSKFDLKLIGDGSEGVYSGHSKAQYIMDNPVSVDCRAIYNNYDFFHLNENELQFLKINLDFIRKYLPDIVQNLEREWCNNFIKVLENSENIVQFNDFVVKLNESKIGPHIVNISQIPIQPPEPIEFCEIPVDHILEIANNVVSNIT